MRSMLTSTQVPEFQAVLVTKLVAEIAVRDQLQLQSWGANQRWPSQAGLPRVTKSS